MPELPEVETTVTGLKTRVLNRTFVDVWTDWEKIIKKPSRFGDFKKEIIGKKIISVWRRAKNIIVDLSGGYSLLIHQKMTGHLLHGKWRQESGVWKSIERGPMDDPYNRFLHVIFSLDNGDMVALCDSRKFAKIELWQSGDLQRELEKLGPEPLEKSFTVESLKKCLAGKKGKIKQVLMIPEVVSGVGNIYSSEALWLAKVHPERRADSLTEKELDDLYLGLRKVLQLGVDLGGESFSDYRKIDGTGGEFHAERHVYKREAQPCHRCDGIIERKMFGGRSAFFCPKCQK